MSNKEVEIDNQTHNGLVFINHTYISDDDDGELFISEGNGINGLHETSKTCY